MKGHEGAAGTKLGVLWVLFDMSKGDAENPPATLGDVLYGKSKAPVAERTWTTLVQSIAAGDQLALHALFTAGDGRAIAKTYRVRSRLILDATDMPGRKVTAASMRQR